MFWPVTLLGALTGWLLAGIPGALLGALLGQVVDRRMQLDSWSAWHRFSYRQPELQGDELLFVLLGCLAKVGGRVHEAHIRTARAEMQRRQLGKTQQLLAIKAFNRGKSGKDSLRESLERLQSNPQEAKTLLQACWRMARAVEQSDTRERERILLWGKWLGWAPEAVVALDVGRRQGFSSGRPSAYQDALRLLGVNTDSEPQAIKQAYRRLLSQHHPDKLAGLGASPARIREATERTGELHEAYLLVRQRRGFR
ncbi:DnaJ domain-containing protein [Azomonas macrocytogenes]|uniref:DnaJ like chaperone protein n=1 Tax=Azomonas macrocytogenes TaxID=69962 RepID=A0A839SY89_AZOMA|nr:DnaJ domain-containing protein [Azomonas macrocytogenes]MBB3102082.1 DnaJ like chaperone protein [Azomonas macrocytogenes]